MTAVTDLYYDPYDFEIDKDPYPIWKRMRDEAPVYYNEKYDFYALSRYADVEEASTDWETYTSAKGIMIEMIREGIASPPGLFIAEDPPNHTAHRLILSRAVTPRRVAALEGRIRELCAEYLDPFVGSGGFDLVQEFAAQLPMRVIGALVGIPEGDQLELREALDENVRLKEGIPDDEKVDLLLNIGGPYAELLAYRKKHPADDFLSVLIAARFVDPSIGEERALTDMEILTYVGMLNGAGNETTARLIGWLGKTLAEYPDQRAQLVADNSLVGNAVEEMLRYEAPSPVQIRATTRPVEIHGHTIPEGAVVALLTASANRDDRVYANPDTFDIHRKIDSHITFGKGVHYCFGASLARIEGRFALEELLKRFPTWDVDMDNAEMIHTAQVRGYHKLPLVI